MTGYAVDAGVAVKWLVEEEDLALAIQTRHWVVTADKRFHDKVRGHPHLSGHIVRVAQVSPRAGA